MGDPPRQMSTVLRNPFCYRCGWEGEVYKAHDTRLNRIVATKVPRMGAVMRIAGLLGNRRRTLKVLPFLVIHLALVLGVRAQPSSGSYVAAFRTHKHVIASKPDVFHATVEEIVHYLESNKVNLVSDPLRARIETQDPISIDSLVRITKDVGASYLVYITVDRPVSQWLKVTVECYDLDEKMLWRESAGYTGLVDVNSKKALPEIMKKLGKQLSVRIGKSGLMLRPDSTSAPSAAGENPPQ